MERGTADPEPLTIRSLVEWYKTQVRAASLTQEEIDYINGRWVHLVTRLAQELEVPVGWLASSLYDLVEHEIRLSLTAEAEVTEALV